MARIEVTEYETDVQIETSEKATELLLCDFCGQEVEDEANFHTLALNPTRAVETEVRPVDTKGMVRFHAHGVEWVDGNGRVFEYDSASDMKQILRRLCDRSVSAENATITAQTEVDAAMEVCEYCADYLFEEKYGERSELE